MPTKGRRSKRNGTAATRKNKRRGPVTDGIFYYSYDKYGIEKILISHEGGGKPFRQERLS